MKRVVVVSNRVMFPAEQKPEAAGGLAVALLDTLQEDLLEYDIGKWNDNELRNPAAEKLNNPND